jgi:primosomal replication protein N
VNRNRIDLVGTVVSVPEARTTPSGTPVLRIEVNCGEGREILRLGVVTAGSDVCQLGARIVAGAMVRVLGMLRAARGRVWPSAAGGVEVMAVEISKVVKDASS